MRQTPLPSRNSSEARQIEAMHKRRFHARTIAKKMGWTLNQVNYALTTWGFRLPLEFMKGTSPAARQLLELILQEREIVARGKDISRRFRQKR